MNPVHDEPSFHLSSPELDLHLTARAGHLAPVTYHLPGRDVSPYSLSPWEPAEFPDLPPLLSVLRGDFLCFPFGEQKDGPPHGDPANAEWSLIEQTDRSLKLEMTASDSGARIEKIISTKPNQHAVFAEHRISNLTGNFNYGTHPILDLSHLPDGAGRISTSSFQWASVFPGDFANKDDGETQSLESGALFSDLRQVPLAAGGTTDLTHYPQRKGYEDLVMMANAPATKEQPFAWSAAVIDGYVWFSLKNPRDSPATLFWISNGGRTAAPWNGRHLGRIGIEEVCSYFCHGVDKSRENLLAKEGIPTTRTFQSDETVRLPMIQAVAAVPENFSVVSSITPNGQNTVTITDDQNTSVTTAIDWSFVL